MGEVNYAPQARRQPRRHQPRETEIEASRLVLRDSSGTARLMLDAGGAADGFASICIFSRDGSGSMQVGTRPGGDVVMSFGNDDRLTISARGIVLRAQDGRLGVVIGPVVDGRDDVTVYRDGQPVWTSSSPRPAKKGHRPAPKRRRKPGGPAGSAR